MSTRDTLQDEQWELIERLLASPPVRSTGRGRPWKNNREVLNGIIWILRSGARWKDLPRDFPSYHGIPIAIHAGSASPHEVTLVEETLEQNFLSDAPERLIGDGAYDSGPLDERLEERGIEMIRHCLFYPSLLTHKQRFFSSESLLCFQNSRDQFPRRIRIRTNVDLYVFRAPARAP